MDGSLTALSCGVGQRWMGLFFLRALPLTTNYYILVLFFFECLPSWESYSDICNQQLLAVIEESHLTGWRESYIYLCYGQITKECFSFFKMLNNWSPIKSGGHNIISHRVQKCEMCQTDTLYSLLILLQNYVIPVFMHRSSNKCISSFWSRESSWPTSRQFWKSFQQQLWYSAAILSNKTASSAFFIIHSIHSEVTRRFSKSHFEYQNLPSINLRRLE